MLSSVGQVIQGYAELNSRQQNNVFISQRPKSRMLCESGLLKRRAETRLRQEPAQKVRLLNCQTPVFTHQGALLADCHIAQRSKKRHREDCETINPETTGSRTTKRARVSEDQNITHHTFPGKEKKMVASSEDSFNSFLYWQPILPDIESELIQLSRTSLDEESDHAMCVSEETTEDCSFSHFNYWREPILDIDIDSSLI